MAEIVMEKANRIIVAKGAYTPNQVIKNTLTNIQTITWSQIPSGGQKMTLVDLDGDPIIELVSSGPNSNTGQETIVVPFPSKTGIQVNGIKVARLDAGQIYIYLCGSL